MGFLIRNFQTYKLQLLGLPVFETSEITWRTFFQKQALTGSLQSNCSKQQLKVLGRTASVSEKDFTMNVLFHKKLQRAKIKTSKGKIKFLQCQCWCQRQCRSWYRDGNAEIYKWPTINSSESLARTFLFLQ